VRDEFLKSTLDEAYKTTTYSISMERRASMLYMNHQQRCFGGVTIINMLFRKKILLSLV